MNKFEHEYTLLDIKPLMRKRIIQNEQNIVALVKEGPEISIHRLSTVLGILKEMQLSNLFI